MDSTAYQKTGGLPIRVAESATGEEITEVATRDANREVPPQYHLQCESSGYAVQLHSIYHQTTQLLAQLDRFIRLEGKPHQPESVAPEALCSAYG